jgi:hypothetical protein
MRRRLIWGIVAFSLFAAGLAFVAAEEEDPLAELAKMESSLRTEGPDAGGTVRAKSDAALKAAASIKGAAKALIVAELIENRRPKVGFFSALKVRVIAPPSGGSFAGRLKKDQVVWVLPKFKVKGGALDKGDPLTEILSGTRALKKGDILLIRPVEYSKGYYLADFVEKK